MLASNAQRVLLVERSNRIGGMVKTIQYDGFSFPVGAHHLSGLQKKGLIQRIFKQLKISIDQLLVSVPQMDVQLDGVFYTLPLSVNGLADYIHKEFPQEERYDEFIQVFQRYCSYYIGNNESELLRFFKETSCLSFDSFLGRYFQDNRLKKLLAFLGPIYGGLNYHDSAFSHLSLLVSYFSGTGYVHSGIQTLIHHLSACLDRLQVDVMLHTQYDSVIQEGKIVVGINCHDQWTNEQISLTAKNVILTIDPSETLLNQFPTLRASSKIQKLIPGPTAIRMVGVVSHILDGVRSSDISCIGTGRSILLTEDCNELPMYMLCYPEMADGKFPNGKTSFMLTFLSRTATNISPQVLKYKIMDLLEQFVPDLYTTIESCCIFSAGIYRQLSGHPTGAAFGWTRNEKTIMNTNAFAPCVSGIQNLYICGNWSTDFGIYGVLRSAECVVQVIQKRK